MKIRWLLERRVWHLQDHPLFQHALRIPTRVVLVVSFFVTITIHNNNGWVFVLYVQKLGGNVTDVNAQIIYPQTYVTIVGGLKIHNILILRQKVIPMRVGTNSERRIIGDL